MSSQHQTPDACTHAHLSPNDPTSTIQEVYSDNPSTSSSSAHEYATFECSACKAAHSSTHTSSPPPPPAPAPENASPAHYCHSGCSGCTECYCTDDENTDSDLYADIQAWSDMVQCSEIEHLSIRSRYSDRPSFSRRSSREGSIGDEEHGCTYETLFDRDEVERDQKAIAFLALLALTCILMFASVLYAVLRVVAAGNF